MVEENNHKNIVGMGLPQGQRVVKLIKLIGQIIKWKLQVQIIYKPHLYIFLFTFILYFRYLYMLPNKHFEDFV